MTEQESDALNSIRYALFITVNLSAKKALETLEIQSSYRVEGPLKRLDSEQFDMPKLTAKNQTNQKSKLMIT